jgi:putative ABC transport system permease protein
MLWLVRRTITGAPQRLLLAAVAVAFPVATLAATLLFADDSVQTMTRVALQPVQVEMRAIATSLGTDMNQAGAALARVPAVRQVDRFASADVILSSPSGGRVAARLFAVDSTYFAHHSFVQPQGDVAQGVLLNEGLADTPGFAGASSITVDLPGDAPPLGLTVPRAGRVDLRPAAPTWFAIASGDTQGDIAVVPRAVVVDYATFERAVLPALRAALGTTSDVATAGLSALPAASVEAHVSVDHNAYPPDPQRAKAWSTRLRRILERQTPGAVLVADNTAEPLTEAGVDATNAKVLFLLLGIPGVLVAGALGLAAASALAEAHRRDDALLRLRGASDRQLVRLAVGQGTVAGAVGTALGLVVAAAGVSTVLGHPPWRDIPTSRLVVTIGVAIAAGTITTAARLIPLVRAGRRSALAVERRRVTGTWQPRWRRARLDVVALVVGAAILGVNVLAGGLKPAPIEGQALVLSFYTLLAPLALWAGATLLAGRVLLAVLSRWSRPERPRPLRSWGSAIVRWLGRRPAHTAVALLLGALAVAFGTEAATFVATYRTAKQADTRAAFASDLRLVPATDNARLPQSLGPDVVATTALRSVPARAGSDRKSIMAIDPATYRQAVTSAPRIIQGQGLDALARDPSGVLVALELAKSFAVQPGDTLPVTLYPDSPELARKVNLRVVGVFRAFPPTEPLSELVVANTVLPAPTPPPQTYLARVAPGRNADAVARALRQDAVGKAFTVSTIGDRSRVQQRTLTALNLDGLSRIELTAAGLIAAIGVGVLGAFLVLERRREFAVLHTVGATTRQVVAGPVIEGAIAAVGSLVLGIPIGIGLAVLSVRVLGLFFVLPPPLATVPVGGIAVLAGLVVAVSAVALAVAVQRVVRVDPATILREP